MIEWRRYTSEGYVLAAVPVLGWFAALSYEKGYANYYSYPLELIQVDLKSVLLSLMAIVLYVSVILFFLDLVSKGLRSENVFLKSLGKIGIFCVVPMFGAFILALDRGQLYVLLMVSIIALCFLYVPPIFGKEGSYIERLSKEVDGFRPFGMSAEHFDIRRSDLSAHSRFSLLICFGLIFYGLCYGAGGFEAQRKEDFYLHEFNGSSYVVLASYGDLIIYSRLDGKKVTEDILVKSSGAGDGDFYRKIKLVPGGGK